MATQIFTETAEEMSKGAGFHTIMTRILKGGKGGKGSKDSEGGEGGEEKADRRHPE
jgi:hypothetical protein